MEVMFHFFFELIKISILGCIYATITLLAFTVIGHFKRDSWIGRVSRKKARLWLISGFSISAALFFFMFSYFGNHGLGDSAVVPIGHFKTVNQINSSAAYIENGEGRQLGISKFTFDQDNLFAKTDPEFNAWSGQYVVWNLRTDEWTFFQTEEDYLSAARQNNYPHPGRFEPFRNFYDRHWSGWRFWFLP